MQSEQLRVVSIACKLLKPEQYDVGVLQSLSRSVRTIHTTMVSPNVVAPLLALLDDIPSVQVRDTLATGECSALCTQVAALSALCNLVLDFSPFRQVCSPSVLSIWTA